MTERTFIVDCACSVLGTNHLQGYMHTIIDNAVVRITINIAWRRGLRRPRPGGLLGRCYARFRRRCREQLIQECIKPIHVACFCEGAEFFTAVRFDAEQDLKNVFNQFSTAASDILSIIPSDRIDVTDAFSVASWIQDRIVVM